MKKVETGWIFNEPQSAKTDTDCAKVGAAPRHKFTLGIIAAGKEGAAQYRNEAPSWEGIVR